MLIIQLAIAIIVLIGMWKVFSKAGQPGWAVLIPIYNAYVMLKVAGKPGWWLILLFIPGVNLVIGIIATIGIATNFGKGGGYAVGLIFLPFIFYPMLGFGSAQYLTAEEAAPAAAPEAAPEPAPAEDETPQP